MARGKLIAGAVLVLGILLVGGCLHSRGWTQRGRASYYGTKFHGRITASGERFDMNALTAAHRDLPFGTRVRVTAWATGRSVVVTINDRGPFAKGRILDLSREAARRLGALEAGVIEVEIKVLSWGDR